METFCSDLFIGDIWKITADPGAASNIAIQSYVNDDIGYKTVLELPPATADPPPSSADPPPSSTEAA